MELETDEIKKLREDLKNTSKKIKLNKLFLRIDRADYFIRSVPYALLFLIPFVLLFTIGFKGIQLIVDRKFLDALGYLFISAYLTIYAGIILFAFFEGILKFLDEIISKLLERLWKKVSKKDRTEYENLKLRKRQIESEIKALEFKHIFRSTNTKTQSSRNYYKTDQANTKLKSSVKSLSSQETLKTKTPTSSSTQIANSEAITSNKKTSIPLIARPTVSSTIPLDKKTATHEETQQVELKDFNKGLDKARADAISIIAKAIGIDKSLKDAIEEGFKTILNYYKENAKNVNEGKLHEAFIEGLISNKDFKNIKIVEAKRRRENLKNAGISDIKIKELLNELGYTDDEISLPNTKEATPQKIIETNLHKSIIIKSATNKIISKESTINNLYEIFSQTESSPKKDLIKNSNEIIGQHKITSDDYIALNKKKQDIGFAGELFIFRKEKDKFRWSGKMDLYEKIEHVSLKDDTVGYDIISFDKLGNKKLIEVKTTSQDYMSEFYLTKTELNKLNEMDNYYIYRVFNFDIETETGSIYIINGLKDLQNYFITVPFNYKICPKGNAYY